MATLGMSAAERDAIERFRRDVVDPSMDALVLIDFWSERSALSKQVTPLLAKIAADYADRGVRLVKINADEERMIADQFRVQTIPAVYALFQGQIVADLTPAARTERQLVQTLDQILRQLPIKGAAAEAHDQIAPLIAMGEEVLDQGDVERALSIFGQLAELAPEDPGVIAGHARALTLAGELDAAEAALAAVPEPAAKDPGIARARAALALAREAGPAADIAPFLARIAADPDDHEARFELAGALMAAGDRDGAADALLASIERDRGWNDGAARARLLKLFEAVGLEDPWVSAQRRRLSAILFT